jgi:hypothetical protein
VVSALEGVRAVAVSTFFSFHYIPDGWRASQIRNMGALEGNEPVSDNDWEKITRGGDDAIKRWIDGQMSGRRCAVVLIGSATAGRKWINYEITKAWTDKKGVVGVHAHNLLDVNGKQSKKGRNPFDEFTLGSDKKEFSAIVKVYDPPFSTSRKVYNHISENIADWVDEAIAIRRKY